MSVDRIWSFHVVDGRALAARPDDEPGAALRRDGRPTVRAFLACIRPSPFAVTA